MTDPFLTSVGVSNADAAMRNSLRAALQRNKTYKTGAPSADRLALRQEWARLIKRVAKAYSQPVADRHHCEAIASICQELSAGFGRHLDGGRLRFGTSQKALNLYLKFLWRLGSIPSPPHCPVDRTVLQEVRLPGSWTTCDSEAEYMTWIEAVRRLAEKRTLADWESDLFMRRTPNNAYLDSSVKREVKSGHRRTPRR
jgi:hypothetical protein